MTEPPAPAPDFAELPEIRSYDAWKHEVSNPPLRRRVPAAWRSVWPYGLDYVGEASRAVGNAHQLGQILGVLASVGGSELSNLCSKQWGWHGHDPDLVIWLSWAHYRNLAWGALNLAEDNAREAGLPQNLLSSGLELALGDLRQHPIFRLPEVDDRWEDMRPRGSAYSSFAAGAATMALLPFVQAIAQQAGVRAFDAIRARLRRTGREETTPEGQRILVFTDRTGNTRFEAPEGLPDAALRALTTCTANELVRPWPAPGKTATILWDESTQRWRRIEE